MGLDQKEESGEAGLGEIHPGPEGEAAERDFVTDSGN